MTSLDPGSSGTREALTEVALGLLHGGVKQYAYDRAFLDIGYERYEADPEAANRSIS